MDMPSACRSSRLALILAAPALVWTLAGPPGLAHASPSPTNEGGPTLTADRTGALDPNEDRITVIGRGFRPGSEVRVKTCDPAQGPDKACDSDLGEDPVRVDTDGTFGRQLRVRAAFGGVDCLHTRCAVATTKVGGGGDRSQETYLPIGFRGEAPGLPATWPPAPAVAPGDEDASAVPPAPVSPSASTDSATSSAQNNDAQRNPWILPAVMAGVIAVIAVIVVFVLRNRRQAGTGRDSGDQ
ncbi:neocarzinostatin apoprotein domain-containing protein [Embleya sp. NPDC005575]|uniref:neocarzinostatin apoprotein domain-containing protein n=1 Tax=Embleya sp. NPDC005575 TaxID=3156892 RepID=UPI0033A2906D